MIITDAEVFLLQIVWGPIFGISLVGIWDGSFLFPRWTRKFPKWALLCLDILVLVLMSWLLVVII